MRRFVLVAFALVVLAVSGLTQEKPKAAEQEATPPRTDQLGDPLPPGAVARIGTTRLWSGMSYHPLAFTADGKILACGDSRWTVRLYDSATGKQLRVIHLHDDRISSFALAPDGKTLVTASWQSPVLRLWDVLTGKELRQIPGDPQGTNTVAFSADGKMLAALGREPVIRVWDVTTWQETRQLTGHDKYVISLAFLPDGKTLVSAGGDKTIRWYSVATGQEVRRLDLELIHQGELFASPDGQRLAAVVKPGVLHLWDAASGKEISRTALSEKQTIGHLCFSPDGRVLALAKFTQTGDPPSNDYHYETLFLEAATGRELRRWKEGPPVRRLAFSPDGKFLAQQTHSFIHLHDATTGKLAVQSSRLPNYVMAVAFSANGKALVTGCQGGHVGRWDALTGKALVPPRSPEGFEPLPGVLARPGLSRGGELAALGDAKGVMHVWETATATGLCRIAEPPLEWSSAVFSRDGKILAVRNKNAVIGLWEPRSGKPLLQMPMPHRFAYPFAFSPDGRLLAIRGSMMDDRRSFSLWDTGTGKEVQSFTWEDDTHASAVAITPDARFVVSAHWAAPGPAYRRKAEGLLRLWDISSGRVLHYYHGLPVFPHVPARPTAIAISPDGKTLAAGASGPNWQRGETGLVQLWELATGQERGRFASHETTVEALAFSPNSRLLASGSSDYTALVWDVTGLCPDGQWSARELASKDVERLWAELGGADGAQSFRAMWALAAAPRQAVPFLAQHLRPVVPPKKDQLTRLVADLDSAKFDVRQQAEKELRKLGDLAESALREALSGSPSLETRRRLEALLAPIDRRLLTADQLHAVRALEVLEHVGTPEALRVLEAVAGGTFDTRVTRAAKESLQRRSFSAP